MIKIQMMQMVNENKTVGSKENKEIVNGIMKAAVHCHTHEEKN